VKNQLYQVVSFVAVGAYFVPIIIVMVKRLWPLLPFLLFALYWLLGGLVNLIEFVPLPKSAIETITVIYNMLDMPIVLCIFYFSSSSASIKKFTRIAMPGYALLTLVNCMVRGLNYDALKYVLGVGLLLVLVSIVWEIILYLQKIKHTSHEKAMLFIYAAMLFEYGTYVVIYIFDYFLPGVSTTTDNFFVYYISSLVALSVAVCGFLTRGLNAPRHPLENSFNRKFSEYSLQKEL
jgi:hypothetical protein